jgi:hypothetical protein
LKSAENHAERSHALLSASGSERWINCPASPRLEENFPEETSIYAQEGTLAHEMAELMLKVDLKLMPMAEYRTKIEAFRKHELYKSEFEEPIKEYVDYVKLQFTEAKRVDPKAVILIEQKFDLTKYVEGGFGTSDCAIMTAGKIEVIDLKFGAGKAVSAKDNPQLKYYALGVLEQLSPTDGLYVTMTIVQPRMSNIQSDGIPSKFLRDWGENVLKPKAVEAYRGDGAQVPGNWCQFCKASPRCKALSDLAMEQLARDFDQIDDPRLINDTELLALYQSADFITKFLADVKASVLKEALAGKKWQGFKLVEGKSNRVIIDDKKVIAILEGELYEPEDYVNTKLKGLGDLEKLLKKANFEKLIGHLVVKPAGAPTLVDENDKRETYGVSQITRDFEEFADAEDDDLN